MGLVHHVNQSNMYLLDKDNDIAKFDSLQDILMAYYK